MIYIRKWRESSSPPAFTVDGDKIYQGRAGGSPIYEIRDNRIYANHGGTPLYTIVGNNIYPGRDHAGIPQFKVVGNKIYSGQMTNESPIYEIDD